jgi:WD40 repeat protein
MVTASSDGTVRMWELSGGEIWSWKSELSPASIDVSPDGGIIAVGDGNIGKLLDPSGRRTGKLDSGLETHNGSILAIDFSPDGRRIITASKDKTVKLWTAEGELLDTFTEHEGAVTACAFSPEGGYFATGDRNGVVHFWTAEGEHIRKIDRIEKEWSPKLGAPLTREVRSIVFFDSDAAAAGAGSEHAGYPVLAAACEDGMMVLYNIELDEALESRGLMKGFSLGSVVHTGGYLFAGLFSNIAAFHLETMRQIAFPGHVLAFSELAVNPAADLAAVSSMGGRSALLFWADGELYGTLEPEETGTVQGASAGAASAENADYQPHITDLGFHPGGGGLFTVYDGGSEGGMIHLLDGETVFPISPYQIGDNFAFGNEGKYLYWISEYGNALTRLDMSTGFWETLQSLPDSGDDKYPSVSAVVPGTAFAAGYPSGTVVYGTWTGEYTRLDGSIRLSEYRSTGGGRDLELCPGGDRIVHMDDKGFIKVWDRDGKLLGIRRSFALSSLKQVEKTGPDNGVFDPERWKEDWLMGSLFPTDINQRIDLPGGRRIAFSGDGGRFASGGWDGTVRLWTKDGDLVKSYLGERKPVRGIDFSKDDDLLFYITEDAKINIINLENDKRVTIFSDGEEWVIYTPDGYWDASPGGGDMLAVVRGTEAWNIDQFAVRFNRPDIILTRLGSEDRERIDFFYSRYRKRLKRLGLEEKDFEQGYRVPEAEILSSEKDGKFLTLRLAFSDADEKLTSYNIYVNDVPLFGAFGKPLNGRERRVMETIELNSGDNKIEVSCMNGKGTESFRDVTYGRYDREPAGNLYFIGFGVSVYRNRDIADLRYAHRDVLDLAELFSKTASREGGFNQVITRTFTDEEVNAGNLRGVKSVLEQASVDDTVVLFISGHGIHDYDQYATYYFLTHRADLRDLGGTAVNFDELEELLHGIPPRRKLFLMDTCGSGELDPEAVEQVRAAAGESKGVRARYAGVERGLIRAEEEDSRGAEQDVRAYLQYKNRFIYNDLLRRSGAIVFSSCRGDEVSYESFEYRNGLFTEYIIAALEGDGDRDGDGMVTTEELRSFVRQGVAEETESDPLLYQIPQHPTVDRDNIYQKFGFPVLRDR